MRKKQAPARLDRTIRIFGSDLAQCHFERNLVSQDFRPKHMAMVSALNKKPARPDERARVSGLWVKVYAYDLRKRGPRNIALAGQEAKDENLAEALLQGLNSSFRWILVRAYEAFERFVKRLYADIGYLDSRLWRCRDFGNVGIGEISRLPWKWYWERARDERKIDCVLSRMRSQLGELHSLETNNVFRGVNLEHWQKVIKLLRNHIVHAEGTVIPDDFIGKIGKTIGRKPKDGVIAALGGERFRIWFKEFSETPVLWLVNDEALDSPLYFQLSAPLELLLKILTSHACLVYSMAVKHFGEEPFWDRNTSKSQKGRG